MATMAEEWFRAEGARCFLNRERYADADEQEIERRRLALSRAARAAAQKNGGIQPDTPERRTGDAVSP